jgi:hypothetical protein
MKPAWKQFSIQYFSWLWHYCCHQQSTDIIKYVGKYLRQIFYIFLFDIYMETGRSQLTPKNKGEFVVLFSDFSVLVTKFLGYLVVHVFIQEVLPLEYQNF